MAEAREMTCIVREGVMCWTPSSFDLIDILKRAPNVMCPAKQEVTNLILTLFRENDFSLSLNSSFHRGKFELSRIVFYQYVFKYFIFLLKYG